MRTPSVRLCIILPNPQNKTRLAHSGNNCKSNPLAQKMRGSLTPIHRCTPFVSGRTGAYLDGKIDQRRAERVVFQLEREGTVIHKLRQCLFTHQCISRRQTTVEQYRMLRTRKSRTPPDVPVSSTTCVRIDRRCAHRTTSSGTHLVTRKHSK